MFQLPNIITIFRILLVPVFASRSRCRATPRG